MVVMKFGGSSLINAAAFQHIASIIKAHAFSRRLVVLSAVKGVTDMLVNALTEALKDESSVKSVIMKLRTLHHTIVQEGIESAELRHELIHTIDEKLDQAFRLLSGIALTGEATPRVQDRVVSYGERLSVVIMTGFLQQMGIEARGIEADAMGLVARGEWGNGTVYRDVARKSVNAYFKPLLKSQVLPVITGFFGATEEGDVITFGRGGTDYSAAVLADLLNGERLEVWKDVDGFLSGHPQVVEDSQFLSSLSFEEAAELAYFGAGILHPRTVEPLLDRRIPIVVKNTFNPDKVGTWISERRKVSEQVIKSVTYDRNVALLRVHGVDVGYAVGLLSKLVSRLGDQNINIRSVMTSQTCINILVNKKDLQTAHQYLTSLDLPDVDAIDPVENAALVAVVGEGLGRSEGVVGRIITRLTQTGHHIEMIVSGASKVAAYFLVREDQLESAVRTTHETLFEK